MTSPSSSEWPRGTGGMAVRVRAHDWAATPLGPIGAWPRSLRTAVDIVLGSGHAMQLAWGPERTIIYNDAYAPMLGERHPAALGQPFREAWPDVWDEIAPLVDRVFAGETVRFEDMPLVMTRHGFPEDTWWNFSYSPVRDEAEAVAGLLNVTVDATPKVRADRAEATLGASEGRQAFLLKLSDILQRLRDAADIKAAAMRALGEHLDIGRAQYHEVDESGDYYSADGIGHANGLPLLDLKYRIDDFGTFVGRDFAAGRLFVSDDLRLDPRPTPAEHDAYEQYGIRAGAGAPLIRGGRLVAILALHDVRARHWSEVDLDLIRETAERVWTAVERSRTDRVLRESEERFRALLTAGVYTIYRMSPDWRVMHQLDSATLAVTAAPIEDWVGKYIPDTDLPAVRAAIGLAIGTKSMFELEHRVRRADGSIGWVLSRAVPLLDAAGEITEWFGAGSDVTDRRRAAELLRESERKYRGLFETMGQGYVEAEIVRDGDGRAVDSRLIELNPAFERLTGVPVAAARGRTNREIFPGIEDWWVQTADRVVRSGTTESADYAVASIDRHYQVQFYPGAGDRYTAIYEDITEQKRTEASLRESEERQSFLLTLSDALRPIAEPLDVPRIASRILGERLCADRVAYAEFDADEDTARLIFEHTAAGAPPLPQDSYRWSDFDPAGHARGRLGQTISRSDVQGAGDLTPAQKEVFAAVGFGAFINVPLVKSGRLVAFTAVHWQHPREITPAEIGLAEETAERTWAAVERARAEVAKRESERRFRQFGEASSDVLWIVDAATGQVEYLSPAFDRVWGVPRQTVLSDLRRWAEMLHPEDRERALTALPRALAGEGVLQEYRIIRGDGAVRYITDVGFPIFGDDGRVVRVGGIAQDLTERRQAEAAVRASERQLQLLMEGVPQLVWRAVGEGLWTWASPQWAAFTGQAGERSHGSGWLDAVHPDDREAMVQSWAGAVGRGEFQAECRLLDVAEQRYCWFQNRASAVRDEAGAIVEWLGTSTDVDDLRQLQARQGVMVAELQHRTRNLITVVKAISHQTVREATSLPDFRSRFRDRLEALSRVQGLLSQLTAGRRVAFDELLGSELAALGAPLDKVTLDGPTGVPLRSATVQTFSLALHELATNALKYGALVVDGGHLTVRWRVHRPDQDDPRLHVDWRETGVDLTRIDDRPRGGGYGRELIENALPYQLGAETSYVLASDGVHCTIEVPIAAMNGVTGPVR